MILPKASTVLINQLKVQLQTKDNRIQELNSKLTELEAKKEAFLKDYMEKVDAIQRKISEEASEKLTLENAIQILEAELPAMETVVTPPSEEPQ
jgi:uncharacterized phage infection (PIP) family protein YhgE